MFDKWYKKESPLFSMLGMGGGNASRLVGGVVSSISSASGGNVHNGITPGNGYKYHVFTSPGTFSATVEGVEYPIEILAVAAGDPGGTSAPGSGAASGGGGGGGGVVVKDITLVAGTTPISVNVASSAGSNSVIGSSPQPFFTTVYGGGKGGNADSPTPQRQGQGGGSGGGGADNQNGGAGNSPPVSTPQSPQQGYPGGNAPGGRTGGGGGGSGEAGYNAGSVHAGGPQDPVGNGGPYPNLTAGDGGNGAPYPGFAGPLFPGMPSPWQNKVTANGRYGGGGGGGGYNYENPGPKGGDGGLGGGGNGGNRGGSAGEANTGGGGGGGGAADSSENGGAGASGIVIVRYAV